MEREKWQRRSSALLFAVLILFGIYILLKYTFVILLPFFVALAISTPIHALAKRSSSALGGSVKAWSRFYVAVFWLIFALTVTLVLRRLYGEAHELVGYLEENIEVISRTVGSFSDKAFGISGSSPLLSGLGELGEKINEGISYALAEIGQKSSEALATALGNVAVAMPKVVVGIVVAVVSSFYLCGDFEQIKEYLLGFIGSRSRHKVQRILGQVAGGIKAYAKAYFWLFLITFAELYLGLLFLGRRYALLVALMLSLLDMLPLFGAGVFVVPWGILLILNGETFVGTGLLILLGVMSIIRQIIEPRLVGKKLGIHPLASLCSMYVGFRLFGFWGMILAPVSVLVIKELRKASERAGDGALSTQNE